MKVYTPAEVASQIESSPSALRKYSLLLESEGMTFKRNAKNSREYTEADVITIKRMLYLVRSDGVTLDNAAYAVIKDKQYANTRTAEDGSTTNAVERHDRDIAPLLIGEVKALKDQIEMQQKTIEGFQSAQEKRDTYFVEVLENLQGEIERLSVQLPDKQQLEAPQQPVQTPKKSLFSRIFNK